MRCSRAFFLGVVACVVWGHGPPPAAAQPALAVASCEVVPPEALVEALRLRVDGAVDYVPGAETDAGAWVLDVETEDGGARLTLRAPDGRVWSRAVAPGSSSEAERVRAIALQADYVASLAGAPFSRGDLPAAPEASAAASRDRAGLLLEILSGGSGDLWGQGSGEDTGIDVLGRIGLEWPWGLWVELESGWQRVSGTGAPDVALDLVPIRVGVGGAIPLGSWEIRFALQAIAGWWRAAGEGLHPAGWRGGAGLVAGGTYRFVPWCMVGLEAGMEYEPRAVEIDYLGEPAATLGQLRWRVGATVGFEVAAL